MSSWGWQPELRPALGGHGAPWIRPFLAAAPWLTVLVLAMTLYLAGETLTISRGTLFDLPVAGQGECATTDLVALMLSTPKETLVFFDDSRYVFGDAASVSEFGRHLSERVRATGNKKLLVLADRRVSTGDLLSFVSQSRRHGVEQVLVAEKRESVGE